MKNPRVDPLPAPEYLGNELALAHPECNGLPHDTLVWACSGRATKENGCVGLWYK